MTGKNTLHHKPKWCIWKRLPTRDWILLTWKKWPLLCKKHNLILNVDNCFATPVGQQPIQYGADLVVHSATKWIDGQGRVMGGVVVGKKELIKEIFLFCRSTGPALSPFNAWVLSNSLDTLDVRMERHASNAFTWLNNWNIILRLAG